MVLTAIAKGQTMQAEFDDPSQGRTAARSFRGKYLSVASYKRDGTAVATPVWFVEQDGRLLVQTGAHSGKVKRIRHNPAIGIAMCTASGRLRGEQVSAVAEVLRESAAMDAQRLIMRKYRAEMVIIGPLRFAQSALSYVLSAPHFSRKRAESVVLAITPS
ncbi:MAG TPA: PPOX class F420-dependent oxidoreductase [Streptosporangiaceae bacterium]|nr:PPOX class F420-dependent oxidoreductase [Streptosporangiaceae bacterium]